MKTEKQRLTRIFPWALSCMKEYSTDSHYILSDNRYPVIFEYQGQEVADVTIAVNNGDPIENRLIYGEIVGLKVDQS